MHIWLIVSYVPANLVSACLRLHVDLLARKNIFKFLITLVIIGWYLHQYTSWFVGRHQSFRCTIYVKLIYLELNDSLFHNHNLAVSLNLISGSINPITEYATIGSHSGNVLIMCNFHSTSFQFMYIFTDDDQHVVDDFYIYNLFLFHHLPV